MRSRALAAPTTKACFLAAAGCWAVKGTRHRSQRDSHSVTAPRGMTTSRGTRAGCSHLTARLVLALRSTSGSSNAGLGLGIAAALSRRYRLQQHCHALVLPGVAGTSSWLRAVASSLGCRRRTLASCWLCRRNWSGAVGSAAFGENAATAERFACGLPGFARVSVLGLAVPALRSASRALSRGRLWTEGSRPAAAGNWDDKRPRASEGAKFSRRLAFVATWTKWGRPMGREGEIGRVKHSHRFTPL